MAPSAKNPAVMAPPSSQQVSRPASDRPRLPKDRYKLATQEAVGGRRRVGLFLSEAERPEPVRIIEIISLRSKDLEAALGRVTVLRNLRDGLSNRGYKVLWRTFEPSKFKSIIFFMGALRWLTTALGGHLLPMQAILALQTRLQSREEVAPGGPRLIYIDSVRLAHLAPKMKAKAGDRVLVDFDDLLSRRIAGAARRREPISLGAFRNMVPDVLAKALEGSRLLQRCLYGLEKRLTRRAELIAAKTADALAFASPHEAELFHRLLRRHQPQRIPPLLVLGPTLPEQTIDIARIRATPPPSDIRFIFIGTDALDQNRVAIEEILSLAQAGRLAAPVHIYGRMQRKYDDVASVHFHGFAENLDQVYLPGSILLIPRSIRGGVKTKILEAFNHGVPVIAAGAAFEGYGVSYPWRRDGDSLRRLVSDVASLRAGYQGALAAGLEICQQRFSRETYWTELQAYIDGERAAD